MGFRPASRVKDPFTIIVDTPQDSWGPHCAGARHFPWLSKPARPSVPAGPRPPSPTLFEAPRARPAPASTTFWPPPRSNPISIPNLTMKSSSAAGLFQFIDQTWLGTLKQAGPAFGYGDYANAISRNSVRPLLRGRSGNAQRDHEVAQRSERQCGDGRGADAAECRRARPPHRAPADGERALHRPFLRRRRCRQAHPARRQQPPGQRRRGLSERGARQPLDLLRSAGQCPQHAGRLFRARPPLQGRERRPGCDAGERGGDADAGAAGRGCGARRPAGRARRSPTSPGSPRSLPPRLRARRRPRPRAAARPRARRRRPEHRPSIRCSATRTGAPPSIPWWCRCGAFRRASPTAAPAAPRRPSIPRSRAAATTAPPRRRSICSRTRARMRARCSAAARSNTRSEQDRGAAHRRPAR